MTSKKKIKAELKTLTANVQLLRRMARYVQIEEHDFGALIPANMIEYALDFSKIGNLTRWLASAAEFDDNDTDRPEKSFGTSTQTGIAPDIEMPIIRLNEPLIIEDVEDGFSTGTYSKIDLELVKRFLLAHQPYGDDQETCSCEGPDSENVNDYDTWVQHVIEQIKRSVRQ